MFRQVIETQTAKKQHLVEILATALSLLLPKKLESNLHLERIIDHAVTLANQMTEEQGLFCCFLAEVGSDPKDNLLIKVADQTQTGLVIVCTFPGFGRKIIDDGKERFECIMKANAELQSAFYKDTV